ncbi:hypothetical protein AB833_10245 [Chromatiales bacterium (ex Bugula neritina AB1)]|nr:hypothetical protein AB833_10245 [Chromatiales bacterium (ex Bugula neritina AB1)]
MNTPTSPAAWLNTLTGTRIRISTPGSETASRVTVIEYEERPNSTPPVFTRHEFVEVFYVTEGVLTFQFQHEKRFRIGSGQSVTCPSWKPHSFWNETDKPVSVLLICTPAGLDEFFIESDQLLRESNAEDSVSVDTAMKTLRTKYGLEHVGQPPVL